MKPKCSPHHAFVLVLLALGLLAACAQGDPVAPPTQIVTEDATILMNLTALPEPTRQSTPTTLAPTPTPNCSTFPGEIRQDSLESEALGKVLNFQLYLPPCYDRDADQAYPVLYLLHGLEADMDQWVAIGLPAAMDTLISSGEVDPYIIVMPGEPNTYPPDVSVYPEVLVDELTPYIDANYATLADRESRALGGNSRGAAWALRIGLDHPDLFSSIGMHSLTIFNGDASSSLRQLEALPPQQMPRLFTDIGSEDGELKAAQAFEMALNEALIPHTWYQFSGTHNLAYWQDHLPTYLRWYASGW